MKMRPFACALVLIGTGGSVTTAYAQTAPSFDCGKADGEIEEMICNDGELAALDRRLAETYAAALHSLDDAVDREPATRELKAIQRGWIKGRNDCWKAAGRRDCVVFNYQSRDAELTARYMLIEGIEPVFFVCNDNPSDELAAYFYPTDLPSARLERGDSIAIGVLTRSGSGSKYLADPGITFWTKGDEAQVDWPEGTGFTCAVRK